MASVLIVAENTVGVGSRAICISHRSLGVPAQLGVDKVLLDLGLLALLLMGEMGDRAWIERVIAGALEDVQAEGAKKSEPCRGCIYPSLVHSRTMNDGRNELGSQSG